MLRRSLITGLMALGLTPAIASVQKMNPTDEVDALYELLKKVRMAKTIRLPEIDTFVKPIYWEMSRNRPRDKSDKTHRLIVQFVTEDGRYGSISYGVTVDGRRHVEPVMWTDLCTDCGTRQKFADLQRHAKYEQASFNRRQLELDRAARRAVFSSQRKV